MVGCIDRYYHCNIYYCIYISFFVSIFFSFFLPIFLSFFLCYFLSFFLSFFVTFFLSFYHTYLLSHFLLAQYSFDGERLHPLRRRAAGECFQFSEYTHQKDTLSAHPSQVRTFIFEWET